MTLVPEPTPVVATILTAVEFRFASDLGASYRIEFTGDLETWETLESGIAGTGAEVIRFYSTEGILFRGIRPVLE